jgi:hypothetical protein
MISIVSAELPDANQNLNTSEDWDVSQQKNG